VHRFSLSCSQGQDCLEAALDYLVWHKSTPLNVLKLPLFCSLVYALKCSPLWAKKTLQASSPQYLSPHISLHTSARNTRSSSVPLLCVPFRRTSFARRSFSTAALLTWNSPATCYFKLRLSAFKSRLKTCLFTTAFC